MNRNILKIFASLTICAGLALFVTARGGNDDRDDPITGTWNCIVPPAGGFPQVIVVKNIHADGTMIEIDNAVPPSQESPTVGNWVRTGPRTYVLSLQQLSFDPAGTFVGTFHYTNPLTMTTSRNNMSGTFDYTLVDAGGNVIATGSGNVNCTRFVSN